MSRRRPQARSPKSAGVSSRRGSGEAERGAERGAAPAVAPAERVPAAGRARGRDVLLALLLATAIVLAYAPVRGFEFVVYDDGEYVYDNPHVSAGLTADGVVWAFTAVHSANWHPLTWLSHMLDVTWFGLDAGGHHATNVALHALAAVALFGALRTMTGAPFASVWVAALFALHPLRVESVAWVAERKDVLSAVFWTAAMWAYAGYARAPTRGRYLGGAALFVLGLLAKPMVVTLPAALLLLDVWPLGRTALARGARQEDPPRAVPLRALVVEKLPLLALSAVASAITFEAQRRGGAVASLEAVPLGGRVANAIVAYATYLGKALWPTDLAVFYPYRHSLPIGEVIAAAVVLTAVSGLALRAFPRRPYLLVGWLWYLGTLVPVIGLVRVGEQAMADRFTYLPMIGPLMAVAWGISDLVVAHGARARRLAAAAALVAVIACIAATRAQLAHWRDSVTLFERALAVTEGSHVAELNLAAALVQRGRAAEATAHARAAIELRPRDARGHVNLGAALAQSGRIEEARAAYERALAVDPEAAMAHVDLALLLSEQGRFEEAVAHYRAALRIAPDYAKAHSGLGWALARLERNDEAVASFRAAIAADRRLLPAYNGLALLLEQSGRFQEALDVWAAALAIDPDEFRLRANRAAALAERGRLEEAEAEYRALLRVHPDLVEERVALADVLAERGARAAAADELRTARDLAAGSGRSDLAAAIDERLRTLPADGAGR